MKASVITINYYSTHLIHPMERLVSSIDDVELIVVDNSGEFEPLLGTTVVVVPEANLGFGRGCNLGAEPASGDVLLFLNPDAHIAREVLQRLIELAPTYGDSAVWGPAILDGSGRVPTLRHGGRFGLMFRREYPFPDDHPGGQADVLFVSGACLVLTPGLFRKLKGFSQDIFMYAEDLDLCLRAQRLGASVVMHCGLKISHAGGRSASRLGVRFKRLGRSFRGHYRFLRNHGVGILPAAFNALHLASGLRI